MLEEITTADAEAETNSVENNNLSVSEYAAQRIGGNEDIQEEPESNESEEVGSIQSEDVLSQLDLDEMSEEELRELSDKLGSRAVARYGELTAKRKAAEERLAALEKKLNDDDPLSGNRRVKNNPFDNIENLSDLQAKSDEIAGIVEWAEDLLFESDSYSADDIITEVNGTEYTKSQVRNILKDSRKAEKTFLPDRLKKLQAIEDGEKAEAAFSDRARKELPWLNDEESQTKKKYEQTINDARFKKLKEIAKREAPDVAGQLDYWFAHASNSIYGRKEVGSNNGFALNPSSSGVPSSSSPDRRQGSQAKALKDLQARFRQTGNARDFAEIRKLQMQT